MDETTYRLLEVAGSWLAGIGSLLAVVVALYLARAESTIRLKIDAGHRLIITPGVEENAEAISISVANTGARPVVITNVLWKMGIVRRRLRCSSYWFLTGQLAHPPNLGTGPQRVILHST
jgi:hypothetical protein